MKQSKFFSKTQKSITRDEVSISSQLLIRAGFIDKVSAGIYTLMPLGFRVVTRIISIIRDEMEKVGGQEIYMPGLVPKSNWEQTDRWDNFDALFKLKGADGKDYALGSTHEEIVTPLAKKFVFSYRDLPVGIFQIQNKFRDEIRAKSGLLRTREFLMKDLYSFHKNEEDLDKYYEILKDSYWKIFERVGIKDQSYLVYASGGSFSKYSHEFQTESEAGEDEIFVCKSCRVGLNRELLEDKYKCLECGGEDYNKKKCVEVGNIFKLRTKFSEPFKLFVKDEAGNDHLVEMGCYGIGIQRLMGTVAEVLHDQNGLVWPKEISPYDVHLIGLNLDDSKVSDEAERIYSELKESGIMVLFDDRQDVNAGPKLKDADLIGIGTRVVVSGKTVGKKLIEFKERTDTGSSLISLEELISKLKK